MVKQEPQEYIETALARQLDVCLIGSLPPPHGGVSVHVLRLARALASRNNLACVVNTSAKFAALPDSGDVRVFEVASLRSAFEVFRYLRARKDTIIHFHTSRLASWKRLCLLSLFVTFFRRHKKVLTIHGGRFCGELSNPIKRAFVNRTLAGFHMLVPVSKELRDTLIEIGQQSSRVRVVPAYIPQQVDTPMAPIEMNAVEQSRILVLSSGYLISLYGFETIFDCIDRLPAEKFHFVFVFYSDREEPYASQILERAERFPNVTILGEQTPETFLGLLRLSDVYVRATSEDGDAVAIREALANGVSVFATNAVSRPSECELFPCGDESALLRLLLGAQKKEEEIGESEPESSSIDLLMSCYAKVAITELNT